MSESLLYRRHVGLWLAICAATILGMILLGGVTRLTNSGLSMVEWRPLLGIIPPLNHEQWLAVFAKYKSSPEYQIVNAGMSLDEFKYIFMYEYLHRVLGRIIGILFFVPYLYFLIKGRIPVGYRGKLALLFILGGCQGLLGWFMVKSGLVDDPRVSHYRLTAHLGLAVLIFGFMLWLTCSLLDRPPATDHAAGQSAISRTVARVAALFAGLLYLMILSGGLVAGSRAGYAWSTWPLMGDSFIPPGLYATTPLWLAAFEDITTIQFNHRMFAYLLALLGAGLVAAVWRHSQDLLARRAALLLGALLTAQIVLGIYTIVHHVPIASAAAHQVVGVALFGTAIYLARRLTVMAPATSG
jgi:cytochrome c oxidase assembly protein subunit 15